MKMDRSKIAPVILARESVILLAKELKDYTCFALNSANNSDKAVQIRISTPSLVEDLNLSLNDFNAKVLLPSILNLAKAIKKSVSSQAILLFFKLTAENDYTAFASCDGISCQVAIVYDVKQDRNILYHTVLLQEIKV